MANTKITDLTAWTTPIATDVFAIVDVTAASTKKITLANVLGKMPAGSVTAPSLAFTSDPNSGLYWIGADNIGLALNGAKVVDFGAAQIGFPDGSVGLPGIAFAGDTNSGLYWIGADNIGVTLGGVQKLNIGLASMTFSITCTPNSDDGAALGTGQLSWSDLFLYTGGVINWSNGDVTITHSGNTLAFAGATTGYTFDTVVYINETADGDLTTGLTINQGAADNHILSLKSSDVAHGVTTIAETDTYGAFAKQDADAGGLRITGIRESSGAPGLVLRGIGSAGGGDPPTTSTDANIALNAAVISGTGLTAAAATNSILNVQNNGTNEFVVMGDGELYSNQSATVGTFDDYDDAVMCGDLSYLLAGQYSKIVSHNRELFSRLGIVTGGGMVSLTKMHQLQLGGINQVGQRLTALEQALMARIQGLERQLLAIQGG